MIRSWNKYYLSKILIRILPWDPWLPRCTKNLARSCQDSQDASKRVNPGTAKRGDIVKRLLNTCIAHSNSADLLLSNNASDWLSEWGF